MVHDHCSICSGLDGYEHASQKGGRPDDDTSLPPSASRLTVVRDFAPGADRELQLRQCPECRTSYLYRTDYEFLVNGTEDDQYLARLSEAEAAEYLTAPADTCYRRALDTKFNLR
jgi:hypothetical protein